MVKHIERRSAIEMKEDYLGTMIDTLPLPTPVHKNYFGSRIPNCPMQISDASRNFGCKDLKLCIRSFLHDCQFPQGEGRKHRIKVRNLPQLDDNSQVSL